MLYSISLKQTVGWRRKHQQAEVRDNGLMDANGGRSQKPGFKF